MLTLTSLRSKTVSKMLAFVYAVFALAPSAFSADPMISQTTQQQPTLSAANTSYYQNASSSYYYSGQSLAPSSPLSKPATSPNTTPAPAASPSTSTPSQPAANQSSATNQAANANYYQNASSSYYNTGGSSPAPASKPATSPSTTPAPAASPSTSTPSQPAAPTTPASQPSSSTQSSATNQAANANYYQNASSNYYNTGAPKPPVITRVEETVRNAAETPFGEGRVILEETLKKIFMSDGTVKTENNLIAKIQVPSNVTKPFYVTNPDGSLTQIEILFQDASKTTYRFRTNLTTNGTPTAKSEFYDVTMKPNGDYDLTMYKDSTFTAVKSTIRVTKSSLNQDDSTQIITERTADGGYKISTVEIKKGSLYRMKVETKDANGRLIHDIEQNFSGVTFGVDGRIESGSITFRETHYRTVTYGGRWTYTQIDKRTEGVMTFDQGRVTRFTLKEYTSYGSLVQSKDYLFSDTTFDFEGQIVRGTIHEIIKDKNNVIISNKAVTYDNRVVTRVVSTSFKPNGEILQKSTLVFISQVFDVDNNLISGMVREQIQSASGSLFEENTYTYESGRIVTLNQASYNSSGGLMHRTEISYADVKFSNAGEMISGNISASVTYPDGERLVFKYSVAQGVLTLKSARQENHNEIVETEFGADAVFKDGSFVSGTVTVSTYSKTGALISRMTYEFAASKLKSVQTTESDFRQKYEEINVVRDASGKITSGTTIITRQTLSGIDLDRTEITYSGGNPYRIIYDKYETGKNSIRKTVTYYGVRFAANGEVISGNISLSEYDMVTKKTLRSRSLTYKDGKIISDYGSSNGNDGSSSYYTATGTFDISGNLISGTISHTAYGPQRLTHTKSDITFEGGVMTKSVTTLSNVVGGWRTVVEKVITMNYGSNGEILKISTQNYNANGSKADLVIALYSANLVTKQGQLTTGQISKSITRPDGTKTEMLFEFRDGKLERLRTVDYNQAGSKSQETDSQFDKAVFDANGNVLSGKVTTKITFADGASQYVEMQYANGYFISSTSVAYDKNRQVISQQTSTYQDVKIDSKGSILSGTVKSIVNNLDGSREITTVTYDGGVIKRVSSQIINSDGSLRETTESIFVNAIYDPNGRLISGNQLITVNKQDGSRHEITLTFANGKMVSAVTKIFAPSGKLLEETKSTFSNAGVAIPIVYAFPGGKASSLYSEVVPVLSAGTDRLRLEIPLQRIEMHSMKLIDIKALETLIKKAPTTNQSIGMIEMKGLEIPLGMELQAAPMYPKKEFETIASLYLGGGSWYRSGDSIIVTGKDGRRHTFSSSGKYEVSSSYYDVSKRAYIYKTEKSSYDKAKGIKLETIALSSGFGTTAVAQLKTMKYDAQGKPAGYTLEYKAPDGSKFKFEADASGRGSAVLTLPNGTVKTGTAALQPALINETSFGMLSEMRFDGIIFYFTATGITFESKNQPPLI